MLEDTYEGVSLFIVTVSIETQCITHQYRTY